MTLRQKAIQGAIWSAIEKWGAQLASTVVFLLLARLLGAEAFGLIALANVFLAFMQIFLDQGFAQAIIQREELEPEHLDTAFWTSVLMGALFILVIFMGAGFVAGFYKEPELTPIIRWLSISFLFGGLSSVQAAILQRNMQFKVFAARSMVATVACGIAGAGAAFLGLGVWSLVIKEIVFGFTGAALLWASSDWRPGFRFSTRHFNELFLFGINVVGANFLGFFNKQSDNMLIGYFLGTVALGYYSVAYRLLLIMIQLLTSVTNQVALPAFSRLQREPERMTQAFYKVTRYTSLVSFPAFIGMIVLAPELVPTLFGDEWAPSILVMQILSLIGILKSVQFFIGTVLLAMNKPLWRLQAMFFATAFNVMGFFIAVRWGIAAVASSYVVTGYLYSPVFLVLAKKAIGIDFREYLQQYVVPVSGCVVMVITISITEVILRSWLNPYITLPIHAGAGAASYLATVAAASPGLAQKIHSLMLFTISTLKGKVKQLF